MERWENIRIGIMRQILIEKFGQNEMLKQCLLASENATLIECNIRDQFWGIGLDITDPNCKIPRLWKGQNHLGRLLMEVRQHFTTN
jgi:ribA/ribD-fused uncharacterized protein